jgi:asparagine synthase (glutamine-hydrolysing)
VLARYALAFGRGRHRQRIFERASEMGLELAADESDLLLAVAPGTPRLIDAGLAVIGHIFNSQHQLIGGLPPESKFLWGAAEGYWGNYASFTAHEGNWLVVRDPSGSVPVFRVGLGLDCIFVSDAQLAIGLGFPTETAIDHRFLVHWLQYPMLNCRRTGLQDVLELLPGQSWRRRGNQWIESQAWNPWQHVCSGRVEPCEAARRLRDTIIAVVACQAEGQQHLLQLSGGLDSSIVAAAFHESATLFDAVTFATMSRDGDERLYASKVAEHCGARLSILHERDLKPGLSVPSRNRFRPGPNPILDPLERAVHRHFTSSGMSCLTDGGGGDNLFCYLLTASPVVDALVLGGIGAAWRTIGDIAELTGSNWLQVLNAALRKGFSRTRRWRENRSFLRPIGWLNQSDVHPWLRGPTSALPGKNEHVESLVHIQHFLERRTDGSTSVLHPLMAQPLLELCLSLPSWWWAAGGRDRAIAREAFQGLIPDLILERRTKGSIQGFFYRSFIGRRRRGQSVCRKPRRLRSRVPASGWHRRAAILLIRHHHLHAGRSQRNSLFRELRRSRLRGPSRPRRLVEP